MLEPPPLPTEKIISSLHDSYDIKVSKLDFLPIGNDSNSWVYKAHTKNESYFLKAKRLPVYKPSLAIPHYLKEQGLHQVVAPLPSKTQNLYQTLDDFALILYPFIDGDNGMNLGLSDKQWLEYGVFLKNLHAIKLPDELSTTIQRETFIPHPERLELTKTFQATILEHKPSSTLEKEWIEFWKSKHEEISKIITRTEELGKMLQHEKPQFVLCHADIHTANLLIDKQNNLFVVDWDGPIIAPKERDLMFIGGSIAMLAANTKSALFYQGYERTDINITALAYYRYEWIIQDIGDYVWRIFSADMGEETKQHALQGFRSFFEPGDIVDVAYKSDKAWL
jgi:spectinomycin phosphotransferase